MPAASLVESAAAVGLAQELMEGGQGPRWSLARVRSLLNRGQRALARCQPWLPTPVWLYCSAVAADVDSKAAAIAASHAWWGNSLPAVSQAQMQQAAVPQEIKLLACSACGKHAVQLKVCSACRTAVYW